MNKRILIPLIVLSVLVLGVGFFANEFSVRLQPASLGGLGGAYVSKNPNSVDGIITVLTNDFTEALSKIDKAIEEDKNEWVYSWIIELTQNVTIGNSTINQTFLAGSTLVCFGMNAGPPQTSWGFSVGGGGILCHQFTPRGGGSIPEQDLARIIGALKKIDSIMGEPKGSEVSEYSNPIKDLANGKTPGGMSAGVKFENGHFLEEWLNTNVLAKGKLIHSEKREGSKIDW